MQKHTYQCYISQCFNYSQKALIRSKCLQVICCSMIETHFETHGGRCCLYWNLLPIVFFRITQLSVMWRLQDAFIVLTAIVYRIIITSIRKVQGMRPSRPCSPIYTHRCQGRLRADIELWTQPWGPTLSGLERPWMAFTPRSRLGPNKAISLDRPWPIHSGGPPLPRKYNGRPTYRECELW